jgi:hypothetical protein
MGRHFLNRSAGWPCLSQRAELIRELLAMPGPPGVRVVLALVVYLPGAFGRLVLPFLGPLTAT